MFDVCISDSYRGAGYSRSLCLLSFFLFALKMKNSRRYEVGQRHSALRKGLAVVPRDAHTKVVIINIEVTSARRNNILTRTTRLLLLLDLTSASKHRASSWLTTLLKKSCSVLDYLILWLFSRCWILRSQRSPCVKLREEDGHF